MAVFSGPEIANNGLVLHLDAANSRSYPGTGTTMIDISGNNKNATLINGVSFTNTNKGGLVFDKINDYVSIQNSYATLSLPTGSASRTIITCFKTSSAFSGLPYEHIVHYGSQTVDAAYGIALFLLSGQYYISNHTWSGTSYMSSYPAITNSLYWVAVTYDNSASPKNSFFVNGTFGTVAFGQGKVSDYTINTGSGFELNLSTRIGPAEYFGGEIYLTQVYNRALSSTEIRQNFEATRGRYGI
jgi:hypothetical protein